MKQRLTAQSLKGIWAGPPLFWDEHYLLDEQPQIENWKRTCALKPHGIYILGSTAEFYALDFDEFRHVTSLFLSAVCDSDLPTQVGCGGLSTRQIVRQIEFAVEKGADSAQVSLPCWESLTDRELLGFFQDLHAACPQVPIVHYNIPRAKRFLTAPDYRRILDVCPNLIGVKFTFAGSNFSALQECVRSVPELSFLVGENLLVSGMLLGARGSCSSVVYWYPEITLSLYQKAAQGKWEEAAELQKALDAFLADLDAFLEANGMGGFDPIADKGVALATGVLVGHPRVRPPYIGWTEDEVQELRNWLRSRDDMFAIS